MNCLEFRRRYDEDPRSSDPALLEHRRSCTRCAAFAARGARFERKLAAALKLPLPENLDARILMRQSFDRSAGLRARRWVGLALAASVMLALGLGVTLFETEREPPLNEEVLSLIEQAGHALVPTTPVDLHQVRLALKPVGIEIGQDIGIVTFASPCVVRGKLAGHLVLRGEKAPITVLVMPGEHLDGPLAVDESDAVGVVLPATGGVIAIVGARGEALEPVAKLVRSAVGWSA